jgi:hypothetical protein
MKENVRAIVQHVVNVSPPGMEVTVIFSHKASGSIQAATSIGNEAALIEVLKSLLQSHTKEVVIHKA